MKKTSRSRKINSRKYKRRIDRRVSEWVKKYHRNIGTNRLAWISRYNVILKVARICKLKTT